MRTLIAISGCEVYEREGLQQPMRETWLVDALSLGFDYKFFHGNNGGIPREDVVVVECADEYHDLTRKAKEKIKWAYEHNYDFVFCCFPDTYACAERLTKCGYENFDYFGDLLYHINGEYCQGGAGFFLSKAACKHVISTPIPEDRPNDDTFIGGIMRDHTEMKRGDSRFFNWVGIHPTNGPLKGNNVVACHLSQDTPHGYEAKYMYQKHDLWLNSIGGKVPDRVIASRTIIDPVIFPLSMIDPNNSPKRIARR